jgi:hypothetical protein
MESVWQQAAKKKFPGAEVKGDGPFALYSQCCEAGAVWLYYFEAEVRQAQNKRCGHAFCQMKHVAYKLQPAVQGAGFQPAHSVGYDWD